MSRPPVLTWTLRAAPLVLLLCFVAYFVSVQINAVAYLAGTRTAIVGGTTPPVPLDTDTAAATDIAAGLVFETIAAFIILIAVTLSRAMIRDAISHRSRARAQR